MLTENVSLINQPGQDRYASLLAKVCTALVLS